LCFLELKLDNYKTLTQSEENPKAQEITTLLFFAFFVEYAISKL